jgi:hypothetical protein
MGASYDEYGKYFTPHRSPFCGALFEASSFNFDKLEASRKLGNPASKFTSL